MTADRVANLESLVSEHFANASVNRDTVMALFEKLKAQPPQLFLENAVFSTERPYGRKLLFHSREVEVLIMGFLPDRECPPHDHGDADGLVLVCHGTARHKLFRRELNELQLVSETEEPANQVLDAPVDCVHSMGNASQIEELVTLHVYWPPICQMSVFDVAHKQIYLVNGKAGAWLPVDPSTLIETQQMK